MKLTYENTPNCPNCGKKPYRRGHIVEKQWEIPGDDSLVQCCVCMHCSGAWTLDASGSKPKWRKPTSDEWEKMRDHLLPAMAQFVVNRFVADHIRRATPTAGNA